MGALKRRGWKPLTNYGPTSYTMSLTLKRQSISVVFVRPPAVARRILWSRVYPSFVLLSVQVFPWNWIIIRFPWILVCVGRNSYEVVCDRARVSGKNFFCFKNWGNGPKMSFLNLKENLVINCHWICSIMKIYISCCVLAQILYWERSCSWDKGQNALSHSDWRIFKSTISAEQVDEIASFFVCWYKLTKIKSWSKIF